jgi:hypothetical protein
MGTNNVNRTVNSPNAIYGIRPGFNISDLDAYSGFGIPVFTAVSVAGLSGVFQNARFLSIAASFTDPTTSCNIDLYTWDGSAATLVYTAVGANAYNQSFFMGGAEGVDLQGRPFKIGVSNIVGSGQITVSYRING